MKKQRANILMIFLAYLQVSQNHELPPACRFDNRRGIIKCDTLEAFSSQTIPFNRTNGYTVGLEISDMSGGQFNLSKLQALAPDLYSLDISGYNFTIIGNQLTNFSELKELSISTDFSFDILSLDKLRLNSQLTHLKLRGIDIGNDGLKLKKLKYLNLSNITEVSFVSCKLKRIPTLLLNGTKITKLDVSNNHIENLVYDETEKYDCLLLERLTHLNISNNNLSSLNVRGCGNLQMSHLDASRNSLVSFFFMAESSDNLTDIQYGLFSSPLKDQKEITKKFSNLIYLSLRHNYLSLINGQTILELGKLTTLDFGYNRLESISFSPEKEKGKIEKKSLKELFLDNNNITRVYVVKQIVVKFEKLQIISLKNNQWHCDCKDVEDMVAIKNSKTLLRWDSFIYMNCFSGEIETLYQRPIYAIDQIQACNDTDYTTANTCFIVITYTILIAIIIASYTSCLEHAIPFLVKQLTPPEDTTLGRTFDAVIVYKENIENNIQVREKLYDPLKKLGYNIAIHEDIFRVDNIEANIDNILKKSRRMIVYADKPMSSDEVSLRMLNKGIQEEYQTEGFKIIALVHPLLPKNLKKDLYDLVTSRTYIMSDDSCYLQKIIKFLPKRSLNFIEDENLTVKGYKEWLRKELNRIHMEEEDCKIQTPHITSRQSVNICNLADEKIDEDSEYSTKM